MNLIIKILPIFFFFLPFNSDHVRSQDIDHNKKKEIIEVCKLSKKIKTLDVSSEIILECEYLVKQAETVGIYHLDISPINNLPKEYAKLKKLVKQEEQSPGFENTEEMNVISRQQYSEQNNNEYNKMSDWQKKSKCEDHFSKIYENYEDIKYSCKDVEKLGSPIFVDYEVIDCSSKNISQEHIVNCDYHYRRNEVLNRDKNLVYSRDYVGDWTDGYTTIEEEERKKQEIKLKEIEESKRIVKLDKSYSNDEKLKLLRYWYAKEMYVYMSPIFVLSFSKEQIELMAKLETMDCLQHALNLSEKNWSYSDKITELKDLCGNAKWKVSDHQNLVDLILNRNFFYPHSKKENYNKISKVLFNFPDAISQCEQSIFDLAPSKRPNHENARYIKKFYPEENKNANNINWCLQQIVDGTYKIK